MFMLQMRKAEGQGGTVGQGDIFRREPGCMMRLVTEPDPNYLIYSRYSRQLPRSAMGIWMMRTIWVEGDFQPIL